ncbi:cell division protein FtsA [Candidatus Parcubacteria bacterium]|nr:MAG: cell division protein FtsA [Candidatus Parcubacteria bacterium]
MRDSNIVVGVDIGTSKIATVIGQINEDTTNILGVSEVQSKGIRKGQIVDIEEAAGAINSSLDQAERMAGYSIDRIYVSISGVHIEGQNSKGIVAVSQPESEIAETDVDRVLEAAGAISIPSTRSIIHVLPKTYTVDGESGIKDPIGMTGVRLEVDTHIISANATSVKNIQRVLETEAGVAINSLVFSGIGSSYSVLTETEQELGVVLVDIGAGITSICVFIDGALCYSSVIPIGARHITNDLAIGLRISLESAEKIKLYLSQKLNTKSKQKTSEASDATDELDLSDLRLVEDIKKVSKKTLVDGIIKPRLNELFTMIGLELKKSGYGTQTPAGLVITGGGAKTVGAQESAKRMLSMPVRTGTPHGITGLIDDVEDPSFATSIGLLLFGKDFKTKEKAGFLDGMLNIPSPKMLLSITSKLKKLLKSFKI